MKALADEWQDWEMADRARRKGASSLSLALSMPAGTDPSKVYAAAKDFAETEMGDRRWVMALHNDTGSPHVHLTVARRDLDGRRFHADKEDLFRYRQCSLKSFAPRASKPTPHRERQGELLIRPNGQRSIRSGSAGNYRS
jgi:type IV secretory pathway VirD2 relaxase